MIEATSLFSTILWNKGFMGGNSRIKWGLLKLKTAEIIL